MKRFVAIILLLTLSLSTLASCQIPMLPTTGGGSSEKENEEDKKDKIEEEDKDGDDTAADTEDEEGGIRWNRGYIGSAQNKDYGFAINDTEQQYVYTDVIEMGKSGTKITFTDPYGFADIAEVFLLSSWVKSGDEWVIDEDGINLDNSTTILRKKQSGDMIYTYVSTLDNECVRLCYRAGQNSAPLPKIEITETSEAGTAVNIVRIKEWTDMDSERAYYDILEGKTVNFIGDSLFAGHGVDRDWVWPALLAEKYNMPYRNYGIGGCTLSACEGGANPIIERYDKMIDNDADIIVFEGGRNDYNKLAPIGKVGSRDTSTFCGAVGALIDGLREKYPNAIIIGVTFWNSTNSKEGRECNDYSDAMKAVCKSMGVPCIDATDEAETGIRMTNLEFRKQYSVASSDVCHLNTEGMKLAVPFFEKEIARIVEEELK